VTQPGNDLIGDFQRWLVRSGARGVSRGVGGQIRTAFGRGGGSSDVWESATAMPTDEAPECAWCPVCRAARRMRESGPGLGSQMSAATDALGVVVQDAMSLFESAMAAGRQAAQPADPGRAGHPGPAQPPGGPPHEPDDRG
jgi:hypothetical protein